MSAVAGVLRDGSHSACIGSLDHPSLTPPGEFARLFPLRPRYESSSGSACLGFQAVDRHPRDLADF